MPERKMAEGQSQFLSVAEGLHLRLISFEILFCAKRPSNARLTRKPVREAIGALIARDFGQST
jgi:hypothetical protein